MKKKMKKYILIDSAAILLVIALFSFTKEKSLPEIQNDGDVKTLPLVKNEAFKRGEKLVFRLHYGIIDAGEATLGITDEQKEILGRKTFHVVGLGITKGAFEFFYSVRDRYETFIDEQSIVPWVFIRNVNEGGYKIEQNYVFNHFMKKVDVGGGETFPIEPNMQDMLSAFYCARTMDLSGAKEGEMYSINCFMDKEVWPLKIKFIGRETITTDLGTFKCLKFRPIVQKGRVFKHEEDLNVWITDDKNHIVIKGQADVLVGSIKAELTSYSGLANPVSKVE
jgi:Protein of unknown function (DUF3108)